MPEYIKPTKEQEDEIVSVLDRIQDKEKRKASLVEVAKASKLGFSAGRSVINKLIKQDILRVEYEKGVEYLYRNYYKKNK